MGGCVLRWALRVVGSLLIMIGIVPLTPLIWLLVLVHTPMPIGFRLPFWGTQTIGVALATCGGGLLWLARPRR